MALKTQRSYETAAAAAILLLTWCLPLGAEGPGGGDRRPNLWVLTDDNFGTIKLELITARGGRLFSTTSVFGRRLSSGAGVVTDSSDGGLWGTDFNNSRLFKLSPSGTEELQIAVHEPLGISVDSRDGGVWTSTPATGGRDVVKFSADGHEVVRISGFTDVRSIALDERHGRIWVADWIFDRGTDWAGQIVLLSGTDAQLNGYDASGLSGPRHVRADGFVEPLSVSVNPNRDSDGVGNGWAISRLPAEVVKLSPSGAELLRRAPSANVVETRRVQADPLRGDAWVLAVNPSNGLAQFSSDGNEIGFIPFFDPPPKRGRNEFAVTFELDAYRDVLWAGMWVFRDDYMEPYTGAVIALDPQGHRSVRILATAPVFGIALQAVQAPISILGRDFNRHPKPRITVAVLSRVKFDPLQVDPRSARFGPKRAKTNDYDVRDLNNDGVADLLLHFDVRRSGLTCNDRSAGMTASTYDGMIVEGSDNIESLPCGH